LLLPPPLLRAVLHGDLMALRAALVAVNQFFFFSSSSSL
jgi:hypothetical protein